MNCELARVSKSLLVLSSFERVNWWMVFFFASMFNTLIYHVSIQKIAVLIILKKLKLVF